MPGPQLHTISVVIPVYRAEHSLASLVDEIMAVAGPQLTPAGHQFQITEIMPVWDNGPDRSDETMRSLADRYQLVRPVWLSRNFGQHPATMAGLASAGGDWIVTMDEDGQHDPRHIAALLDTAVAEQATVVYASPSNPPPHGWVRNAASRLAKQILQRAMGFPGAGNFNSFRLILGESGRALSAFAGPGVYLDVALSWISRRMATCSIPMRDEDRASSYTLRSLTSHFWRMVVTSGTRVLRTVAGLGAIIGIIGIVLTIVLVIRQLTAPVATGGWASLMCVLLVSTGMLMVALGVVAEYLGVTVNQAMGKPLYLIVADPAAGPLGRARPGSAPTTPAIAAGVQQLEADEAALAQDERAQ